MVFVFSRINDATTIKFIRWLISKNEPFFRLNTINDISFGELFFSVENSTASLFTTDGKEVSFENIHGMYLHGVTFSVPKAPSKWPGFSGQLTRHLQDQYQHLLDGLFTICTPKVVFGVLPNAGVKINKLATLIAARKIGLNIPQTAIISTKKQLSLLLDTWGRIICKAIEETIYIDTDDIVLSNQLTEEITWKHIDGMATNFFPSLIQKLIEKKYEIRSFFFEGRISSIAIFSQGNEKSRLDVTNIDPENPNRMVPFNLPKDIEEKLCHLMYNLKLNFGSIDLIKALDGNYYFLECNPYGQYGFLSAAGNYHIEKQLANIFTTTK